MLTLYSWLSCKFNDSYAFRRPPAPKPFQGVTQSIVPDMSGEVGPENRCSACGELIDKWNEPLNGLKITSRRYDVSSTYDGLTIVSKRFRSIYEESGFIGLRFRPLPDDPSFHDIYPTRQVTVDRDRSILKFQRWCPVCSRYAWLTSPKTVFTEDSVLAENEFARSDLEFACGDEKRPLRLVGSAVVAVLKAAKLKGLSIVKGDE